MAFDKYQFETFIVRPALSAIGMLSDNAVLLLLGMAAQESGFGTYLVQKGISFSGGIGIYQMESPTYYQAWDNKIQPYPDMRAKIKQYLGYDNRPMVQRLAQDLAFSTIMARIHLSSFAEPLPNCNDLKAQATYWKRWWNSYEGSGTIEEYMENYKKYVSG